MKLLIFLLRIKNFMTHIVCNHLAANGSLVIINDLYQWKNKCHLKFREITPMCYVEGSKKIVCCIDVYQLYKFFFFFRFKCYISREHIAHSYKKMV